MAEYPRNPRKKQPRLTRFNREVLLASTLARCTFCLAIFPTEDIQNWLDEGIGTALCPQCGVDKVTPLAEV